MQLMIFCLIAAIVCPQLVNCDPSQQQTLGQQQSRASGQLASDQNTQNSYGGGEYMAGSALLPLGMDGVPNGFNAKRARKMSAFMPMRGRKDGRDEAHIATMYSLPEANLMSNEEPLPMAYPLVGMSPFRETDGEASILHLVAGNGQPVGVAGAFGGQDLGARLRWVGAPRQFVNQVQQQHQLQQQPIRQSSSYESADLSGGMEPLIMDNGATGSGSANSLMQAKLRRAFHPMRGKKSMGTSSTMLNSEMAALLDEL